MAFSQTDLAAIAAASAKYGVSPQLLLGIAQKESGGASNPDTLTNSASTATGMFQILQSTAMEPGYGVTPLNLSQRTDPVASADFAAQYLARSAAALGGYGPAVAQYTGYNVGAPGSYSFEQAMSAGSSAAQQYGVTSVAGSSSNTTPTLASAGNQIISAGASVVTSAASDGVQSALASWAPWLAEGATRIGFELLGALLLVLALIFMFMSSKTVQVSASSFAALAR